MTGGSHKVLAAALDFSQYLEVLKVLGHAPAAAVELASSDRRGDDQDKDQASRRGGDALPDPEASDYEPSGGEEDRPADGEEPAIGSAGPSHTRGQVPGSELPLSPGAGTGLENELLCKLSKARARAEGAASQVAVDAGAAGGKHWHTVERFVRNVSELGLQRLKLDIVKSLVVAVLGGVVIQTVQLGHTLNNFASDFDRAVLILQERNRILDVDTG